MGTATLCPVHRLINPEREENGHEHSQGHRHPMSGDSTIVSGALAESAALLQRLYLAWEL